MATLEIQKANGLAPFTHGQMYCSLVGRDVERDVIPMMRRYGLGLTVWESALDRPADEPPSASLTAAQV